MKPDRSESAATIAPAAPRYALAWAMLACALAALTLAHPALSGEFLVNPRSDQYIAGFAFRDYAAEALRTQGSFPLWNPYLFGGMPYIDAMHGDIFYPTFLLRMLLPTDVAMTWGMVLHFWFAGVATYALFRAHGLSFYASLVGGIAYMMSGQVAGLVSPGHDGKLFITALFPLTMLVLRFGVRGGKTWAWGALALVIGLAILTPHPQLLQYLLLASGAYALWLAYFEGGKDAPPRPVATNRLGMALGSIAVGIAIGAIQFLPLMQYTPWSPRALGHAWETATSYSMPPEEVVNWFLPQFSGILDNYWGRNPIHLHSEYLGLPVLMLAAAAFGVTDARRRRWTWFWLGLLVVSALWAMGGFVEPFYRIVATLVPGTMFWRAPSTIMFESAFAVAALAALGTQRVVEGSISRRFVTGAWIALAVITMLGVSGALSNAFSGIAANSPHGIEAFEANQSNVTLGSWRMLLFGSLALAAVSAAVLRKVPVHIAAAGLALVVVVDLWSVERQYWLFSPSASRIFANDPAIDHIKNDSIPGRVFTVQLTAQAAFRDPFLNGDAMMSSGVRHVTGYHGNELSRYRDLYGGSPYQGVLERLAQSPAFAQVTNLRWIYTNAPALPEGAFPRFATEKPVLGPVKNSVGTDVWLYRVPGENPPAWIVPAMLKVPDDQALGYLTTTDFPVRSVALFDTASSVQGEQLTAAPPPLAIQARVTKWEPGAIDVELDTPAPAKSALIVSENFYPGWNASVDGQPATVERADYVIMGVPLKAGARRIELRFTDAAFARGKLITLFAIALAIAATIGGVFMERRLARA